MIDFQKDNALGIARDICELGLNPADLLYIIPSEQRSGFYTVVDGNRRLAIIRALANPTMLDEFAIEPQIISGLRRFSTTFNLESVEPIACFEFPNRTAADPWIELRHNGLDGGRGLMPWSTVAQTRFLAGRNRRSPMLQAIDFLLRHGALNEEERSKINDVNFPLSTLGRLMAGGESKKMIGLSISKGKLTTNLPVTEIIKPLKRIVLDIGTKRIDVDDIRKTNDQISYINGFSDAEMPDVSLATAEWNVLDDFGEAEEPPPKAPAKKLPPQRKQPVRRHVVTSRSLNIGPPRIQQIYHELSILVLDQHMNAIAVLMRVFFELSAEHYLLENGIPLRAPGAGRRAR